MLEAFEDCSEWDGGASIATIATGTNAGSAVRATRRGAAGHLATGHGIELALKFHFDGGIEGENFEFAIFAEKRGHERAAHGLAAGFDEGDGALVDGGGFEQGFKNGGEIADGNLFAEELLENALDFAEGEEARDEFIDEFGLRFRESIEKTLGFLTSEKLVRVLADDFGEMRGEDGGLVNDSVAGGEGLFLEAGNDPQSGGSEGGFVGGNAVDRLRGGFGADGEETLLLHFPFGDLHAAQEDDVFARFEF